MKNKTPLFLIGGILFVLVVVLFYVMQPGGDYSEAPDLEAIDQEEQALLNNMSDEERSRLKDEALLMFDQPGYLTFEEIMAGARNGKVKLVSELWKLRRRCPPELSPEECNLRIKIFLREKFQPGGEKLARLFAYYVRYEGHMRSEKPPEGLSPEEQYEWIKGQRRKVMGEEAASLIYGYEEARVDFRGKFQEFMDDTKGLSADERIKKYEQFRRDHYGNYYETIKEREPKFNTYDVEMTLREEQLSGMNSSERDAKVREMRVSYFGEEAARRMEAVDQEIQEDQERKDAYQDAKAKLLEANPSASPAERESMLAQLRKEYFSAEEAEAMARREKMRQEMDQLKE
ncbi:MAG: lipase secretion chaperone [Leptospiraceae bacterium]